MLILNPKCSGLFTKAHLLWKYLRNLCLCTNSVVRSSSPSAFQANWMTHSSFLTVFLPSDIKTNNYSKPNRVSFVPCSWPSPGYHGCPSGCGLPAWQGPPPTQKLSERSQHPSSRPWPPDVQDISKPSALDSAGCLSAETIYHADAAQRRLSCLIFHSSNSWKAIRELPPATGGH